MRLFEIEWSYTRLVKSKSLQIVAQTESEARAKAMIHLEQYGIQSTNAILAIREVTNAYC